MAKSPVLGLIFASTIVAAAPPPADAPARPTATPSTSQTSTPHATWAIDYGAQRCSLVRTVEGADPLTLAIRLIPGHAWADVLLAKADWHDSKIPHAPKIQLVLAPAGSKFETEPVTVPLDNGPAGHVVQMAPPPAFLNALAASDRLDIRVRDQVALSIPVPGAAKAVAALHDCNDALVTAWGIDLKARDALVEQPKPIDMGKWLTETEYPKQAVRDRIMGTVVVRVAVNTLGRVTDCAIVAGSGDGDLDGATCRALKLNARFRPAVGADGRVVAATILETVQWAMPGGRLRN